jgi:hypothetical protein
MMKDKGLHMYRIASKADVHGASLAEEVSKVLVPWLYRLRLRYAAQMYHGESMHCRSAGLLPEQRSQLSSPGLDRVRS